MGTFGTLLMSLKKTADTLDRRNSYPRVVNQRLESFPRQQSVVIFWTSCRYRGKRLRAGQARIYCGQVHRCPFTEDRALRQV